MFAMLAATTAKLTVLQKLQAVPKETWISLIVACLILFMIVRIWKSLKEINEIIPWIALFSLGGAVVLYWTYERTEPKVLAPIFNELAKYLPSKIEYKDAKNK